MMIPEMLAFCLNSKTHCGYMMTQWMHGYHSLSEAVAYDEALHAEKVIAEESQARKRFRPKGKGKGRKGKRSSNWGEDDNEGET